MSLSPIRGKDYFEDPNEQENADDSDDEYSRYLRRNYVNNQLSVDESSPGSFDDSSAIYTGGSSWHTDPDFEPSVSASTVGRFVYNSKRY